MSPEEKARTAIRALKIAISIMEYAQGDRWERECTAKDRERFQKLCKQLGIDAGMI